MGDDSVIRADRRVCGSGKPWRGDSESGVLRLDEAVSELVEVCDFVSQVLEVAEVRRLGFGM